MNHMLSKQFLLVTIMSLIITGTTSITKAQTNDFYDDAPQTELQTNAVIVTGEIGNSYTVDFNSLPLRQVIVKEASFSEPEGKFIGAYQYEGYSLYDILNQAVLDKKNAETFPPIIDLYVEIENLAGEKTVISWGEIYYPVNRHQIIIATKVRRIVPSKTKDLWPLPTLAKLVVSTDLITERNLNAPSKITVKSANVEYPIRRDEQMYSESYRIRGLDKPNPNQKRSVPSVMKEKDRSITYRTVFYGRGLGIHSTTPFTGSMFKEVLADHFPVTKESIKNGLIVAAGIDGYRCVFTLSEIFNRNDQAELLIIPQMNVKGTGAYQLFPSMDFFSDRAIKSVMEIKLLQ